MASFQDNLHPAPLEKGIATGAEPVPLPGSSGLENHEIMPEDDLPPRDRGRAAWTCLTAISVISMATWGEQPIPRQRLGT
jgi:hypothetical protein